MINNARIAQCIFALVACLLASSTLLAATPQTPLDIPAYKIGPGDVLTVSVWKEEGLQQEVLIRPDGGMSFPLAGDLQAGGKSVAELSALLVDKIKRYIPDRRPAGNPQTGAWQPGRNIESGSRLCIRRIHITT